MVSAGSLSFTLSADGSQVTKELGRIQRESQFAAAGLQALFNPATFQGAGLQVFSATTLGLIEDFKDLNAEISLTASLTKNLTQGLASLVALPIPDFQSEALNSLGLGGLSASLEILSLFSSALTAVSIPVQLAERGLAALSGGFELLRVNSQTVAFLFEDIAASLRAAGGALAPFAKFADLAAGSLTRIASASEGARNGLDQGWLATGRFGQQLQKYIGVAQSFQGAIQDLGDAATLLNAYQAASDILDRFGLSLEATFNAAKQAQTLRNQLELVSQSAGGAREDLAFIGSVTQELGVNFDAAAKGYASFSTAANLANLTADQTKATFEGITQATAAFGLSAADTQGVFLALQQSLSSGNVQLEELNQLSERIPGTFNAAASALGVTTSELKTLISTGKVSSANFIPKFAEQLKAFSEPGVVDGINSAEAALNRFNNSLGNLQIASGEGFLTAATIGLNAFSQALDFAAKNEELFSAAIDGLLLASLFKGGVAVLAFTKTIYGMIAAGGQGSLVMSLFGKQITVTTAQIGKLAAQTAIAYAGLLIAYAAFEQLQDSASRTRSAVDSLDKSLLELSKSGKDAGSALEGVGNRAPSLNWLDVPITKLKQIEQEGSTTEKALVAAFGDVATGGLLSLNRLVTYWKTGSAEISTAGQNASDEILIAIGDFSKRAQDILGRSFEFRSTASGPGGVLTELKQIEVQLKQIESARLSVDPSNQEEVNRIAEQENEILKRRAELQKQVSTQQQALNNALTQARQELQNLDAGKLGADGFKQASQQIETQIKLLEKEQQEFNKLTAVAVNTSEEIATSFKKSTKDLEKSYGQTQAVIEEGLASGKLSQEEANQQRLKAEQDFLQEQLRLNQQAGEKLRTELERNAKLRAIDPTKATLTADQEKEYAQQLEQIELDSAKTRIDIAKNTQTAKQQLNEQELQQVRTNQAEAEAILQRSENSRIQAIKERQKAGKISEEQANEEIEAVQKDSITNQINAEKAKQAEVERLRQSGVLTTQQAADQEREILNRLSDLNLQRIDAELKARQETNSKIIEDFEAGIKRAESAIKSSQNSRQQQIGQQQLSGSISPEQAAKAEAEAEQAAIEQTIALRRKQQAEVQQLRSRGVLGAKEAAAQESEILADIGDLQLKRIEGELSAQREAQRAREEAAKKQLESAGKAAEQEVQAVQLAETNKITAIKQRQAAGVLGEDEAAKQIAQINRESTAQTLAIKQQELAQIVTLRSAGIEGAAEEERALISEIATLRSQQADQQIAQTEQVKQAKIQAIQQEIEAEQAAAEFVQALNNSDKQALESRNNLLSAQSALLEAQSGLRQQQIQFQIDAAEKAGRTNQAEQLKKKLLEEQIRLQQQQAAIDLATLRLKQQIQAFELRNQEIAAETAAFEAESALLKAQAEGASLRELSILERMLGARNSQLGAIRSQAAAQAQLNQLEEQTLRTKQQQTAEAFKQQQIQQSTVNSAGVRAAQLNQGRRGSDLGSSLGLGSPQPSARSSSVTAITDKLTDLSFNSDLATAFKAMNTSLALKLSGGAGQIGAAAPGFGGSNLTSKLDELIAVTKQSAGRPNLSISNVNDLGLAGRIYSDISRDSARGAGL